MSPIKISSIPSHDLKDLIERANAGENIQVCLHQEITREITRLGHESQALQRPATLLYVASIPGPADLSEGMEVFYISGGIIRKYSKINGTIYYVALTAA